MVRRMRGSLKFMPASGTAQDERTVRSDYHTAKPVGGVRYGKYYIFYESMGFRMYADYNDVVWAYRKAEDVSGRLSFVSGETESHSLMLVMKNGDRVGIPVGDKDNAVLGLSILQRRNKFVDIGFSREKEGRYL